MALYGHRRHADQVFSALFDAGSYMGLRRLPELFCGFTRRPGAGPTLYPVACAPHAWAAASPLSMLQSCIGLEFDTDRRSIKFVRPGLPSFLDEVRIRNLTLPGVIVDVRLTRVGTGVGLSVEKNVGAASVVVEA